MKARSYAAALDQTLTPMGFERRGSFWSRICGDLLEEVDLQFSQIAGTTSNLWTKDLATEKLLGEAIPWEPPFMVLGGMRIGHLMNGNDRWWRKDPNGPAELAEALRIHAPPYFESWRSLESQARRFGRSETRWSSAPIRIYLALTLHRMGELEEACQALRSPPKRMSPESLAQVESVRQWLGCDTTTEASGA